MSRVAVRSAPDHPAAKAPECHRPFFALLPPPSARAGIASIRDAAPATRGTMRDDRLHITLLMVDDLPFLPPGLVDALVGIAEALEAEPAEIVLDRLIRSPRRSVLVPGAPLPALMDMQRRLSDAMVRAGIPVRRGWRFSPHVTLDFGVRDAVDRPINPIAWHATDFVLLDSWVGLTHHEPLGRWPLTEQRRLL